MENPKLFICVEEFSSYVVKGAKYEVGDIITEPHYRKLALSEKARAFIPFIPPLKKQENENESKGSL